MQEIKKKYEKPIVTVVPLCEEVSLLAATRRDNSFNADVHDFEYGGEI